MLKVRSASLVNKSRCRSRIEYQLVYICYFAERGGRPRFFFGGGTSSTVFVVATGVFLATFTGGSHDGLICTIKIRDNFVKKIIKNNDLVLPNSSSR
jgi:hypothetical protein